MFSEVAVSARRITSRLFLLSLFWMGISHLAAASDVTLAWDQSTDPTVVGYHLYSGTSSGAYTNMMDVGNAVSAVVSNLLPATTYYFAASSYNAAGLESVYSAEAVYSAPAPNVRPTMDPIADVTLNENPGAQTVNLSGITSGASNEIQTLTVSAFSSNPTLVPNPTVNYVSPGTIGTLNFTPVSNSFGVVVMTVMVDDGGATSNTLIRTFGVTIVPPPPFTNLVVAPNNGFRLVLTSPISNRDKLSYSLGPGAPAGAIVGYTRKDGPTLFWAPTSAQASTTNLITIVLTDLTNPSLSTTETVRVVVTDSVAAGVGQTSLQAGQSGTLPVYLTSSDGVTNAAITIGWPGSYFLNPSLTLAAPALVSTSLLNQNTNLVLTLQAAPGQVLQGSNFIGQLTFQTASNQPSAFVSLPATFSMAKKASGAAYLNYFTQNGQVAVVNGQPLLQASLSDGSNMLLTSFGRVGTKYQLLFSTNSSGPTIWYAASTYLQTNITQPVSVPSGGAVQIFKLLQR